MKKCNLFKNIFFCLNYKLYPSFAYEGINLQCDVKILGAQIGQPCYTFLQSHILSFFILVNFSSSKLEATGIVYNTNTITYIHVFGISTRILFY